MKFTSSTASLRGSSNNKQDTVLGINRSNAVNPSKKRKRERAIESASRVPAERINNDIIDSDCGNDDDDHNVCSDNNDSSDWDSSDCDNDCDNDCDDISINDSDDKNTTDIRDWDSKKHYFNIFDGCHSNTDEDEDRYLDVYFRADDSFDDSKITDTAVAATPTSTTKRWNGKFYYSEAAAAGSFRGLFQSQMTLNEVESILEGMFANVETFIEHLYFGNEETVKEFDRNVPPVLFPIKLLGKILELCHRNGIRNRGDKNHDTKSTNKRLRRKSLKTLTLSNLLFVGRTRDEFDCAFRQLSRCDTIQEIVLHDLDFHVMDDDPDLEMRRDSFGEDSFGQLPFNSSIFKGMLMAFNEMESLQVIDINNTRDTIFDDVFADVLLRNSMKKKKKKPIKVLSLSKCILSDCVLTAIFGKDSRVERLLLMDCGDLQGRLPLITNLLKNENRIMQNLQLRNYDERGVMGVPETLELLKALGSNHTLKHLHLDVKCKPAGKSSVLAPALNAKTSQSFCQAIEHLVGLESLALDFLLFAPGRNIVDEAVDYDDDHCKASLRHIWSMLENGIGKNDTLRAFQFMVSGINSPEDSGEFEKFKVWVSEEVNRSLTHALSTKSLSPFSKLIKKRSPLQEYRFYIDGCFDVDPDPTTAFWLSLNVNGIHRLLRQQSDDLELWRDAIVRHSNISIKNQSSTIDPSIVYHVLRQTNGHLINRNNNR